MSQKDKPFGLPTPKEPDKPSGEKHEDEPRPVVSPTEPEGHLKPHLQSVQAQHAEEAPKRTPLVLPKKDDMGQPEATPPLAPSGQKTPKAPAPRFVHENSRAPEGLARFKVRALNYGAQETRYVLAEDEPAARQCYIEGNGLDKVREVLGTGAPEVLLSVKRLPD